MADRGPRLPSVAQVHLESGGTAREEEDPEAAPRGCGLDGHLPGCGGGEVRPSTAPAAPPPSHGPSDLSCLADHEMFYTSKEEGLFAPQGPRPASPPACPGRAHPESAAVRKGTSPRSPGWWRTAERVCRWPCVSGVVGAGTRWPPLQRFGTPHPHRYQPLALPVVRLGRGQRGCWTPGLG